MRLASPRFRREKKTLEAMVGLYCRAQHGAPPRCVECSAFLAYALARLEKCPFVARKPVCSRCPVHCYAPAMRSRIREVMRWSGPRMTLRHPLLAFAHLYDRLNKIDD